MTFTLELRNFKFPNCVVNARSTGGRNPETRYDIFDDEGPVATINYVGYLGYAKVVDPETYKIINFGKKVPDNVIVLNHDNHGMLEFLEKVGVVKKRIGIMPSGYVDLHVVEIDKERLLNLDDKMLKKKRTVRKKKENENEEDMPVEVLKAKTVLRRGCRTR